MDVPDVLEFSRCVNFCFFQLEKHFQHRHFRMFYNLLYCVMADSCVVKIKMCDSGGSHSSGGFYVFNSLMWRKFRSSCCVVSIFVSFKETFYT